MTPYVAYGLDEWMVIAVEIFCSFCIMIGFFTRFMILPPFALMIVSCHHIFTSVVDPIICLNMMALPFLFLGVFMFLLLVGPGKISCDYFLSLYLINRHHDREEDLEEV